MFLKDKFKGGAKGIEKDIGPSFFHLLKGKTPFTPNLTLRVANDILLFVDFASTDKGDGLATTTSTAGVEEVSLYARSPSGAETTYKALDRVDITSGTPVDGTFNFEFSVPPCSESGEWKLSCYISDHIGNLDFPDSGELGAMGLTNTLTVVNRQPDGYLWKGSEAYEGGWRYLDWFGWAQDQVTYPYAYHLEHGWIYTSGSNLSRFHVYDVNTGLWWWIDEDLYPYMYASGRLTGWFYYYAPYGSPGNRWFYDLTRGVDIPENDL